MVMPAKMTSSQRLTPNPGLNQRISGESAFQNPSKMDEFVFFTGKSVAGMGGKINRETRCGMVGWIPKAANLS
jgi:hypothetical protein